MLFGDEFDADNRAEVDRGLRRGEGVKGDVALYFAGDMHCVPEDLAVQKTEVRVEANRAYFVFAHQKLLELT